MKVNFAELLERGLAMTGTLGPRGTPSTGGGTEGPPLKRRRASTSTAERRCNSCGTETSTPFCGNCGRSMDGSNLVGSMSSMPVSGNDAKVTLGNGSHDKSRNASSALHGAQIASPHNHEGGCVDTQLAASCITEVNLLDVRPVQTSIASKFTDGRSLVQTLPR